MKQLHHCVAMIVQLERMFNIAQSKQLHSILYAIQTEIKDLIPKNPALTNVAMLYIGIDDLINVDEKLLYNEYPVEFMSNLNRMINDLMSSGKDYTTEIHTLVAAIDTA